MRQVKTLEQVEENKNLCLDIDCDGKVVYNEEHVIGDKVQGICEKCTRLRYELNE